MYQAGSYTSEQKQLVRTRLWDPAFARRLADTDSSDIRYLCLPGAECLYLRHIDKKFHVGKKSIVAIERREESHTAIQTFLDGQGSVLRGSFEELMDSGGLDPFFPFDIINLDFCGQGFVFPDLRARPRGNEYMRRWGAIESALRRQAANDKAHFEFLLTLAGQRNNGPGKQYLGRQIAALNRICPPGRTVADEKAWLTVALVVPKIVADLALQLRYTIRSFDVLGYRQKGHRHDMAAFSFEFVRISEWLGESTEIRAKHLEHFVRSYYLKSVDYLSPDP